MDGLSVWRALPGGENPKCRLRSAHVLNHQVFCACNADPSHLAGRVGLRRAALEISINVAVAWRSHIEVLPQRLRQLLDVVVETDDAVGADQPDLQRDAVLAREPSMMRKARLDGANRARPRCRMRLSAWGHPAPAPHHRHSDYEYPSHTHSIR